MASVSTLLPAAVCEKLAEDAAQTMLIVVAFQGWYWEHAVKDLRAIGAKLRGKDR